MDMDGGSLRLDLNEVVHALSLSLNLAGAEDGTASKFLPHASRVAYTSSRIARRLELSENDTAHLVLAAMVHDCGISTDAARRAVFAGVPEELEAHAGRGADLVAGVSALAALAPIIRSHHDRFGGPNPSGLMRNSIPLGARIIHLADEVDRRMDDSRFVLDQRDALRDAIRSRSGSCLDPDVVAAWLETAEAEAYWFELVDARHGHHREIQRPIGIEASLSQIEELAAMFGTIVDHKSNFTYEHSVRVGHLAEALARAWGASEGEARLVKIAGFLHDIGKLGVPDEILAKKDPLDAVESARMKRHAFDTFVILSSIRGFERLAGWAAFHHERLDGRGYPFRHGSRDLDRMARVMAMADVFQALNQDRPYRPAMEPGKVLGMINALCADGALDPGLFKVLERDQALFFNIARTMPVPSPARSSLHKGTPDIPEALQAS